MSQKRVLAGHPRLTGQERAEEARSEIRARILSACYDPGLLLTRAKLLGAVAHHVISVGDLVEAVRQIDNHNFDLAILCHTIVEKDATMLIQQLRSRGKVPILRLSRSLYTLAQLQVVDGDRGPANFLQAVSDILAGHTPSWLRYEKEKGIYRLQ
jgi:CheY-like chemotaxis protein